MLTYCLIEEGFTGLARKAAYIQILCVVARTAGIFINKQNIV